MSSLANPTLDNKAQLADAFAKGSTAKSTKVTKIFHAPEGYRRLTINLRYSEIDDPRGMTEDVSG